MDDPLIAVIWLGDELASLGFTICPFIKTPANNTLPYQVFAIYNGVNKAGCGIVNSNKWNSWIGVFYALKCSKKQ